MKPAHFVCLAGLWLLASVPAVGQTVHPAGAATTSVAWQPAANPEAFAVDVDGDNRADVTFSDSNSYPSGPGQPTLRTFAVAPASGAELALDSVEYDSAHRYQTGQPILRAVRWSLAGGYLAYTVLGNGGLGGRGFFRDGQPGYVVVRKTIVGAWHYWWFSVKGATYGSGTSTVNFFGHSGTLLAASTAQLPATEAAAFPNPTAAGWTVRGTGTYQLLSGTGQLLGTGTLQHAAFIDVRALAPGLYVLLVQLADGTWVRQKVVRE